MGLRRAYSSLRRMPGSILTFTDASRIRMDPGAKASPRIESGAGAEPAGGLE